MSRRSRRSSGVGSSVGPPGGSIRSYPKLKLSPAKDAFHTNIYKQQQREALAQQPGIAPQQQHQPPHPPPPSSSVLCAAPPAKRQRIDDAPPAAAAPAAAAAAQLKLTFATTNIRPQQQRYAMQSANQIGQQGAPPTSSIDSTLPHSSAAVSSRSSGRWDSAVDDDPLVDVSPSHTDDDDDGPLLLPAYRPKPHSRSSNTQPHHSRMTLQLTSTQGNTNKETHAQIPLSPAPVLIEPTPSPIEMTQPPTDSTTTTMIAPTPAQLTHLASPPVEQPIDSHDTTSPASTPLPASVSLFGSIPDSTPISAGDTTATGSNLTSHTNLTGGATKRMGRTSAHITLSAVSEGEEGGEVSQQTTTPEGMEEAKVANESDATNTIDDQKQSSPPVVSSSSVGVSTNPLSSPSLSRVPTGGVAVVASSDASLPSSQTSVGPTLPFWPDEFPSLSYLYSDFPDPSAGVASDGDREEAEFQSLARDAPLEHQQVDVSGGGAETEYDDDAYSSQMATQVMQDDANVSQTQRIRQSASSPPCSYAPTQILSSHTQLAMTTTTPPDDIPQPD